ncbi:MAG: arylesterase [Aromatoleum sp.]|nr:arylesterase [Aromatoleum sp.]
MMLRRSVLAVFLAFFAAVASGVPARADPDVPVLLVVGDSISAAHGLVAGQGWVDLLASRLRSERYAHRVVNASITGDTTAGGRARFASLLAQHKPAVVVIELGGNDGLRGGNLKSARENLDTMVTLARRAGAKVLLVGMKLPPNYGPAYTREFDAMFEAVGKAQKVPVVPYFFAGFGENNDFFQPDRIHPTAAAQPMLLDNVWPALKPLLGKPR